MKRLSTGLALGLLLAALAFMAAGCASTEDTQNASVRPWNAPQGWENGLPSTMTEGR
jgi:hypothetical protein